MGHVVAAHRARAQEIASAGHVLALSLEQKTEKRPTYVGYQGRQLGAESSEVKPAHHLARANNTERDRTLIPYPIRAHLTKA
ncbi:hypothetical protein GCM10009069_22090 [Algimonas arctica]|uniref:Uncharacterized protein n=1 Tax=Algimonas arctica TaxID=1479486 RepID=A0A8J3CQX9_9PROT|nr:hypothetical protein GCM10009069_22090 [Algimonas arctica]